MPSVTRVVEVDDPQPMPSMKMFLEQVGMDQAETVRGLTEMRPFPRLSRSRSRSKRLRCRVKSFQSQNRPQRGVSPASPSSHQECRLEGCRGRPRAGLVVHACGELAHDGVGSLDPSGSLPALDPRAPNWAPSIHSNTSTWRGPGTPSQAMCSNALPEREGPPAALRFRWPRAPHPGQLGA